MASGKIPVMPANELQNLLHESLAPSNPVSLEKKFVEPGPPLKYTIKEEAIEHAKTDIQQEIVDSLAEKLVANMDQKLKDGTFTNAPYDSGKPLKNDGIGLEAMYYDLPGGGMDFAAGDHITVEGKQYLITGKSTAIDTGKTTLKLQQIVNMKVSDILPEDKVFMGVDTGNAEKGVWGVVNHGGTDEKHFTVDGPLEIGEAPPPAEGERGKLFAGIGKKKCP